MTTCHDGFAWAGGEVSAEYVARLDAWLAFLEEHDLLDDRAALDRAVDEHIRGMQPPTNAQSWLDSVRSEAASGTWSFRL